MDDVQPPTGADGRTDASTAWPTHDAHAERRRGLHFRHRRSIGRGIITAAVVVAAASGAAALAVVAGLLTLFGWGLAIVVAILAVGVVAAIRPRPANGWLLIPLLALAIPSAAVAISGVRVLPERGRVVAAPTTADQIPRKGYRAGLGDLLLDLRTFRADAGDQVVVRAGSDLGRTVVALPQDRCFNLDVRWRTGNLRLPRVRERPTITGVRPARTPSRLGAQLPGNRKRIGITSGRIAIFGRAYSIADGRWIAPTNHQRAATLTLELESEGGSFVVRDYPNDVSPLQSVDWPIDQSPFPRQQASLEAEIEREERAIATAEARSFPRGRMTKDTQERLAEDAGIAAQTRVAERYNRAFRREMEAFGREWARNLTGACNPRGTFR